jgi:hypothetical protein
MERWLMYYYNACRKLIVVPVLTRRQEKELPQLVNGFCGWEIAYMSSDDEIERLRRSGLLCSEYQYISRQIHLELRQQQR